MIERELKQEGELRGFVKKRWNDKFQNSNTEFNDSKFDEAVDEYIKINKFKINENIFENEQTISDEAHFVMRLVTQYFLTKSFEAMKVDLDDANVREELGDGNIGTPGRISKVWCGANTNDDAELLGGRWAKDVRIASFPSESDNSKKPIIKTIDLNAVCSHHFLPFSSKLKQNSKVVIAYIPQDIVLGISKLPRVVRHIAQRGWLQEDLTKEIFKRISSVAQTESVFVGLYNIVHTCEATRGANSADGGFTSLEWGGEFENPEMRKIVEQAIQM